MSAVRVPVAGLLVLALAACGGGARSQATASPTASPLADVYRANFMRACEGSSNSPAQTNYCDCTADQLEARFDVKQLDALMRDRRLHREFTAITHRCAAAAGLQARP